MKIRHPLEQSLRGTIAVCDQGSEAMERGESEMLDGDGEWPRRPFVRGRKVNPVGCTLMAFFLLAFVFYLWVRISKTLDLAQYTWCAAELQEQQFPAGAPRLRLFPGLPSTLCTCTTHCIICFSVHQVMASCDDVGWRAVSSACKFKLLQRWTLFLNNNM